MSGHCGFVAVVGRPNVGKSTLTNRIVGAKVSITSKKAQTTRHRVNGIISVAGGQLILVDTPGFQVEHRTALTRAMNRNVKSALADVDVVLMVVEAGRWTEKEDLLVKALPTQVPVVLAINKIDKLDDRAQALPFAALVAQKYPFCDVVPISAEQGDGVDRLVQVLLSRVPEQEPIYGEDEFTDRSERFHVAEILREKLFRNLGDELPYALAVQVERFETEGELRRIWAAVIVEKPAHKGIVIGKQGERLKRIASDARRDIERFLGGRVWLETWVKVKGGWADDERLVKSLGYDDQ